MVTPPISRSTNDKIEGRPGTRRPRSSTPAASSPERSRRGVKRWVLEQGVRRPWAPDPERRNRGPKARTARRKSDGNGRRRSLLPPTPCSQPATSRRRRGRGPSPSPSPTRLQLRRYRADPRAHDATTPPGRSAPPSPSQRRAALPAACSGDSEAREERGVKAARRRLGFPLGPPTRAVTDRYCAA
jgi:hypothetical protein